MLQSWPKEAGEEAAQFHKWFDSLTNNRTADWDAFALDLFHWQAKRVPVYKAYLEALKVKPENIKQLDEIPYLPLSFFKSHLVRSWDFKDEATFTSSTTTGQIPAQHSISRLAHYEKHSRHLFETAYGQVSDWVILALLPSYLERGGSSLVYMAEHFIKKGNQIESGFFLYDLAALHKNYEMAKSAGKKVLLLGVSYALLDLAESPFRMHLQAEDVLMETGGMKGRRQELVREELHGILKESFGISAVHSEYGMTELLSQAYSKGGGFYQSPSSLRISIRDVNDPFSLLPHGKTGGVNLIDLANIDSCAFLQTQDLGRLHADGRFEILGRFDHSELRGCNLMVS